MNRFFVSPITLKKDFKIFCLATSVYDIVDYDVIDNKRQNYRIELDPDKLQHYIHRLMLMIASSFRVKQENRTFKSEYVIPQLIMLACNNQGLDGVVSYTVKSTHEVFSRVCGINLTLFAKYPKDKFDPDLKHSDIMSDVSVFDAYCMADYQQLGLATKAEYEDKARHNIDNSKYIKAIGSFRYQFDYRETQFYHFDKFLYGYWKEHERRKKK